MSGKYERLPKDIRWHFIGHLQTNKIKYIINFVELIHAVDSIKLLAEINKQAVKANRVVDCLLQIHIAEEDTKFGFSESEIIELAKSNILNELPNIRVSGLMGMTTFTEDIEQINREFKNLKNVFEILKINYFSEESGFKIISMGMSSDFKIAIAAGSNMVRVGSSIFGNRIYN
jgi:hypothetical protein